MGLNLPLEELLFVSRTKIRHTRCKCTRAFHNLKLKRIIVYHISTNLWVCNFVFANNIVSSTVEIDAYIVFLNDIDGYDVTCIYNRHI